jgi:hypothetical protein
MHLVECLAGDQRCMRKILTEFLSTNDFDEGSAISIEHAMQPLNVRKAVSSPEVRLENTESAR